MCSADAGGRPAQRSRYDDLLLAAFVGWLKARENEDYFDVGTDFSPFRLKV